MIFFRTCLVAGPRRFGLFWTVVLVLIVTFQTPAVLGQENFESPTPVLVCDGNSSNVLAIEAEKATDSMPRRSSGTFRPGQRIAIFVRDFDLLPDEGANAFRLFAVDKNGKRFRFAAESVAKLARPAGVYTVVFRIQDPVGYNGQPASDTEYALTIAWRGNISKPARLTLGLPSDGRKISIDRESHRPTEIAAAQLNSADRKRFMEQATFGPTKSLDSQLRRFGYRAWINEQIAAPYPTIPYPNHPLAPSGVEQACGDVFGINPEIDLCHREIGYYPIHNWLVKETLYGHSQLRRRVSWSLHKIWPISQLGNVYQQRWLQEYIEILDRNAFGNYRDLMYEMTLSPAMGEYLDMVRSTKQNPNENYPRELLQLFSIGLYMLNQDGTLIRDTQGNRIPTYDQNTIDQFTKVFTGWTQCNTGTLPACSNAVPGTPNFIDPMHVGNGGNHDLTGKTLLNYPGAPNITIAACQNCSTDASRIAYANDSLNKTLDNIFYHPNVGPFIGKILIQHLVTSDPSPAYVGRVAAAFNDNGSGVRGDMKAVIRAILLDPEARGSQKTDPTYGKLREPLEYFTSFLRFYNVRAGSIARDTSMPATPPASCQNQTDGVYFMWALGGMGQWVLRPPTVFSYYPPDFAVPGTDILGPEFGLANAGSSFVRNNFIETFAFYSHWFERPTAAQPYPYVPCGGEIDRSELIALAAADPTGHTLIENLNMTLMHGTMSQAMKDQVRAAINFNVSAENKAKQALYLVLSSSQYQIQR